MLNRKLVLVPALALAVAAAGAGGWLLQRESARRAEEGLSARLLDEVLARVGRFYVEEVDRDSLYEAAIDAVVKQLGDHNSHFLPAAEWEEARIRTEGDYGGVGLEVVNRGGFVTVVAPIPRSPAARAGIQAGDRIVEVNGESVEGWLTELAVRILRGRPGRKVEIGVRRRGVEEIIRFEVERAVIQVPSVPFATMLDDGVGYVPLEGFNETSTAEVRFAVDSLSQEGMTSLILDLRENVGGLLDQGVGVSEFFLDPGMEIVTIKGREQAPETFVAESRQEYPDLPLVVLVDDGSASAAEIVAGALQDHDRGLVLGAPTFGKGSVQTLFRLSAGNVLRLTTARWFTPAGRSIQKDPARSAELRDGPVGFDGGLVERPVELTEKPRFSSAGGRVVYGGGGIVPDLWVVPDTMTTEEYEAVRRLLGAGGDFSAALAVWSLSYVADHPELQPGFRIGEADIRGFHSMLGDGGSASALALEDLLAAQRFVDYFLGAEIARDVWGDLGEFRREAAADLPLQRALEFLRTADAQEELFALAGSPFGAAGELAEKPATGSDGPAGVGGLPGDGVR